MASLADLAISVTGDTSSLKGDFDKVPQFAASATDSAAGKFDGLTPALASAADEAVDAAGTKFEGLSGKLSGAAKLAGAAGGAALVFGVIEGVERGALNDKLAAQINLSPEESAKAGSIAGGLYADAYGSSLEQVNEAVGGVATVLTDLTDTAGVERLSAKALDLASAFDVDVNDAVQQAGTLMKTGLASDADEAFDLVTAGLQEIAPALRADLGEATTEYARFFADLGLSGTEAYGLLAQADDQFELDKTGDALKELSIRATDMSTTSVAAFETAGLDATKMADQILAGGDTARGAFDQIVDGLLGIEDPTERANAAIGLFGTPLEDLGTAQIPAFLEKLDQMGDGLGDVEGRADSMGATLNDNAATNIEGYKRKFEGLLASVVTAPGPFGVATSAIAGAGAVIAPITPALTGMAVVFQDKLSAMASSMASGAGGMISSGAKWVAATVVQGATAVASMAATAASTVAGWVTMAATSTVNAAKMAASWVVSHVTGAATALVALATAVAATVAGWVTMAAQSLVQAARMAASWVIAMGPVGWVIAAVVALVAVIVANWDTIVAWTKQAWTTVTDWIGDKAAAIAGWVGGMRDKVTAFVGGMRDKVVEYVGNLRDRAVTAVTDLRDKVVGFFTDLRDKAVGKIQELKTQGERKWFEIKLAFAKIVDDIKTKVTTAFGDLKDAVVKKVGEVLDFVKGLPGKVLGFYANLGSLLFNAGKSILQGLWNGLKAKWDDVSGWVGGLGSKIKNLKGPIQADRKLLTDEGSAIMDGLGKGLTSGWANNEALLAGMADQMQGTFAGLRLPGVNGLTVAGGDGASAGRQRVTLVIGDREFDGYLSGEMDRHQDGRDRDLVASLRAR